MMGLQEFHPAVVHFPIALVPVSVVADTIGTMTDEPRWSWMGRVLLTTAAGGAAAAATTGLIAQEEVRTSDQAHAMLVTHRTLNAGAGVVIMALAFGRRHRERATWAEIALGVFTVGMLTYSAWLGGRMVYEHGVGVKPAGGLRSDHETDVTALGPRGAARQAAGDLAQGVRHLAEDTADGLVAPALRPSVARQG